MEHLYYRDGAADERIAKMCEALAAGIGAKLTEDWVRGMAIAFSGVPIDEVRRAFRYAAQNLEQGYLPPPGKLMSFIRPSEDDRALIAWSAFAQAAESAGAYTSLDVEDSAAADALALVCGSWPQFCALEDGPELAMKRREFIAAYRQFAREQPRATYAWTRLQGLCGEPPPEKAQLVWTARISVSGRVEQVRGQQQLGAAREPDALPPAREA